MSEVARVLTVDDDPIVRADLRLVLEDAGFDVSTAKDGIEAVELAVEEQPDVIVLDLALPRLSGVEATRKILDRRDVPIVALTGHGREPGGMAAQAIAAGAVSVVSKPFSHQTVVEAVNDALAGNVRAAREASRQALEELLALLGYPESWAESLEARAFAAGKIWVRSDHPERK
jgi:CheY-like chemotaxis protein